MSSGPYSSSSSSTSRSYSSRSGSRSTDRPLGVSIICIIGVIGFFLAFVPILELAGYGGGAGFLALVLLVVNFAHLVVLIGLWNMSASALTWAYVFYGIGLVLDLVTIDVIGVIVSLIILGYLTSVSHKFR